MPQFGNLVAVSRLAASPRDDFVSLFEALVASAIKRIFPAWLFLYPSSHLFPLSVDVVDEPRKLSELIEEPRVRFQDGR